MKLYFTTIEEDLQIMQLYNITAEDLFLVKLLFLAQEDNGRQNYIYTYFIECKKDSLPLEKMFLLGEKKILVKETLPQKGEKFYADNLQFDEKFLKDWFVYSHTAGKALMDLYPNYIKTAQGELLPAKNITKTYFSLESMYASYSKGIRHSKKVHEKVMFLLSWAIENNLIKYGIAEFITSRKWETLSQDYELHKNGLFVDTFDNKKVI